MVIRRANKSEKDLLGIASLLRQVLEIHHQGRPDIFKGGVRKYTDDELKAIIDDDSRPIFVAVDEEENVLGYTFCIFQQELNSHILTDIRTLYIDDLCVDENIRGQHIGSKLYHHVLDFAKEQDCYNVTLNVWSCNPGAQKFYENMGMSPMKTYMEVKL